MAISTMKFQTPGSNEIDHQCKELEFPNRVFFFLPTNEWIHAVENYKASGRIKPSYVEYPVTKCPFCWVKLPEIFTNTYENEQLSYAV